MNLTKVQLQTVGRLVAGINEGKQLYLIRREKITRVAQPFVSGIIEYDEDNNEVGIAAVNGRVIDALEKRSLIDKVGGDSITGVLFKASKSLIQHKEILKKAALSLGERATHVSLARSADKFACRVEFDRTPLLFKLLRQDGRKFTKPYIDTSLTGVKVTRLTDLSIEEWESEIAEVIKRSDLI